MRAALEAARRRVDRFTLALAALSVLGSGLVLAREVNYGVGLTWDAVTYISTARNLLDGEWFRQYDHWPYGHWPPLYPLLLAAFSFGVFDPYAVAGPLNAAIFGLTIFAVGCGLRGRVRNGLLLVWGCAAAALSLPLATLASEALSEPLFILCLTLALLHSVRYFETGRPSALIWAAAFAALALLTRYPGVALLMLMPPLLLLQQGAAWPEKARRLGLYLAIALLPVGWWLLRNYLAYGYIHGPQPPPWNTPGEVLQQYLADVSGWLLLEQSLPLWGAALTAAALIVLAGVVAAAWFKFARNAGPGNWMGCAVFGGFGLIYLAFLAVTQSLLAGVSPLGGRYLVPAYIPLLLAAALALDGLLAGGQRASSGRPSAAGRLFIRTSILKWGEVKSILWLGAVAAFALWSAYSVLLQARAIAYANAYGVGAASAVWADSETLAYARQRLAGERPFLNTYAPMYIAAPEEFRAYRVIAFDLPGAERALAHRKSSGYLAWTDSSATSYNTADLLLLPGLEVAAELSDGAIFRYHRAKAGESPPPTSAWYDSLVAGGPAAAAGGFNLYITKHRSSMSKSPARTRIWPGGSFGISILWRPRPSGAAGISVTSFSSTSSARGATGDA